MAFVVQTIQRTIFVACIAIFTADANITSVARETFNTVVNAVARILITNIVLASYWTCKSASSSIIASYTFRAIATVFKANIVFAMFMALFKTK